jgi:hypothetical protein
VIHFKPNTDNIHATTTISAKPQRTILTAILTAVASVAHVASCSCHSFSFCVSLRVHQSAITATATAAAAAAANL